MVRTRVGYAGGTSEDPAYYNLGDHSETLQVDYDPSILSYSDLLQVFWESHNPEFPAYSRQYASIIFYHDKEQRRLAEESGAREEARRGARLHTEIVPYSAFYLAEDYHQKYRLQGHPGLVEEYRRIYPAMEDFVASTAVARVNGYLGGHGDLATLRKELDSYGLSEAGREELLSTAARSLAW